MSYEAFWIPGLDTDFDSDEALAIGDRWLRSSKYPGEPIIVLNAVEMTRRRDMLARMASRYTVVSPRVRNRGWGHSHAVLAVWPYKEAMVLAERLASPSGGLCVIEASGVQQPAWVAGKRAINLADPDANRKPLVLDPEVRRILDSLLFFDGHNGFISSEGKIRVVRDFRKMVADGFRPDPADVEAYALQSADTDLEGAAKLRSYYEGVLSGRSYRDYGGRPI